MANKKSAAGGKTTAGQIVKGTFAGIGKTIATLFLIFVITGCIVGTTFVIYILQFVNIDPGVDVQKLKLNYTSTIYAIDSETGETYELQRLHSEENRVWASIDQMPKHLLDAAIAAEDKRFNEHHGVDWRRTIYAAANEVLRFSSNRQGGSTITQQLIKNITKEDEVRVERKIREIFSALNLEKEYSKDQILEAYLNTIHLGNNTNGVQAAADLYFGKDVSELTLAESASIIAITQYPVYYNPFSYPENNKDRQEYILNEMLKMGAISQEEHDKAVAEKLEFQTQQYNEQIITTYSWFVDTVIEEVLADMQEQLGYSRQYAVDVLFSGGVKVYTTYNKEVQTLLEEKYADEETFPVVNSQEQPQSCFAILNYEGEIVGIAGGRGTKDLSRAYNRATMSLRSPGSTMKPIASYGPAIESNLITWSTVIEDAPFKDFDDDGEMEWPINYYSGYRGPMTVVEALELSCNPVAAQVCEKVGYENAFYFVRDQLGIGSLVEYKEANGKVFSDINLAPMSVGSLTDGLTMVDLAAAYQVFGNGGIYYEPHSYTLVEDSEGDVLLQKDGSPRRVFSQETATVMNKLLQSVVKNGTGSPARFSNSDMPLAGKTGTTSDNKDLLYVGLTPYYVGAVWMGFDEQKYISYNSPYPPPVVWKNVMEELHEDLPTKNFPESKSVARYEYCAESGFLATEYCTETAIGYYKMSNIPATCELHKPPEGPIWHWGNESSGPIWHWGSSSNTTSSDTIDDSSDPWWWWDTSSDIISDSTSDFTDDSTGLGDAEASRNPFPTN